MAGWRHGIPRHAQRASARRLRRRLRAAAIAVPQSLPMMLREMDVLEAMLEDIDSEISRRMAVSHGQPPPDDGRLERRIVAALRSTTAPGRRKR